MAFPVVALRAAAMILVPTIVLLLRLHVAAALPLDSVKSLLVPAKDGSYGSLEDTLYSVSILSATHDPTLDASKLCQWTKSFKLPSPPTLHVASAYARLSGLVCQKATPALREAETALLEGAGSAQSPRDAYVALEGLAAIKSRRFSTASEAEYGAASKAAADLLEGLKESTGLYKHDKDADETSPLASGFALKALSAILTLDASLKPKTLTKDIKSLFSKATAGELKTLSFQAEPEEGGPLPASSLIASGYFGIASALGSSLEVPKETLAGLGSFLATSGAPLSLFEASLLAEALSAFDFNSVAIPVLLTVPGQVSLSHPSPKIALTTLLGRTVDGATVTLVSAKVMAKGASRAKEVAQDKVLQAEGGSFALPPHIFGPAAALGTYALKLQVTPPDEVHVAISPVTKLLTTTASIALSPVSVAVFDSDAKNPDTEVKVDLAVVGSSQGSLKTVTATHLQHLRVSLTATAPDGKLFVPHQAFLALRHESGVEHFFLLKESSGQLYTSLFLLENLAKLYYQSGIYSLTLTLGDLHMENSGSWPLGKVNLDIPEAPEGAVPPPISAVVTLEERFKPAPEIAHIFRVPDKRPPPAVSYAFTALALLPLLLLLAGLASLGLNLKLMPTSGLPFISVLGLHGGIAAILVLYVAFWVKVNLFTTFKYLAILALATALPGHYILSFLADATAKAKTS